MSGQSAKTIKPNNFFYCVDRAYLITHLAH